jgi:uncharacterized protein YjiS (DUF1127 family)
MHSTAITLSPSLLTKAGRALQGLAANLSHAYDHCLRACQAHATARVLSQLDDRGLRDLGLSRSELLSAGAELHGLAKRERLQTLYGTPLPR